MPEVTVRLDTEKMAEHQRKVFARLRRVEELYPDSLAVRQLHKALEKMQDALLAKMPDGAVQPMSGGDKPPPPGGGG